MSARELITEHLDLWTGAVTKKSSSGRGSNGKVELTGVKKLRELILELAVRGKLVSQGLPAESSSALISGMEEEKARLVASKRIKKPKAVNSVPQEDYPFDIPRGWSWHSLGALGYTQTGSTPAKSKNELFGDDIPFLKPGDISENGDICYDNEGLSEAGKAALGKWAERDSILMVCIGTIGKCGLIEQQCTFNQQINSITPYIPETSQFLLLCLKSPYFQDAAWEKSSSTTISILNKGKWESIPLPVPPLEEQHRIVQKVDELMALCDRLEQQTSDQLEAHETLVDTLLGTLTQSENTTELADNWARLAAHFDTLFTSEQSIDKLKQTIVQLAVMGRLVEQDEGDESALTLLNQISDEKYQLIAKGVVKKPKKLAPIQNDEKRFKLPNGWAWARLDDVFINIVDCPHSTPKFIEQGRLCLDTNSFKDGKLNQDRFRYVSDDTFEKRNARLQPRANDIVFAREGSVGESVVIPQELECCLGQRVMLFRPSRFSEPNFLRLTLSNPLALKVLLSLHKGIGAKHVNVGDMRKYVIALPPANEQHWIMQKVSELMALCDQLKERLNQASETRCQLAETVIDKALH
ncbi:restriction endonuclease subunit S [Marinobacter sp.]|uniref:restriction endonuclease subunit S n=1 Tax=Marinobacter sp. TaxID=50741 RepID=UPI00384E77D6